MHTFFYVADRPLKSVHVVGEFNGWNKDAGAMRLDADGRTWLLTLPLRAGKYQYKLVLNGDTWVTDPNANNESDGNGNTNSVLLLLPADYTSPARPDDGVIARSALFHGTSVAYRNYDRGVLTLSLRTRPNDLSAVTLIVNGVRVPMYALPASVDALYTRWVAHYPWDRKTDLRYTFALNDGAQTLRFGESGLADTATPFVIDAKTFQPFTVPSWTAKTVIYQIFPDRFADGDKANDPSDVVPWDSQPTGRSRFGGDAVGVEQHLDYLNGLGVSAGYFNPVFASPSNHRYDTTDYKQIDPQFGSNAQFAELTRAMQQHGIRTIMDFAFNHTATNFAAFADIRQKGEASPDRDWYFVRGYPVRVGPHPNYVAWFGNASMPKLNVLNPATRDYLLGVTQFWEQTIPLSGMRLDAANEVDPRFWRQLRQRAKAINPNLWIIGEVWGDGSPWLGGDQWDSVMDYPFRSACISFVAEGKTTPSQFVNRLMGIYDSYAPQVSRNLMNLLSSHDTPRFLTLCQGDTRKDRLAAAIQFTWVGVPSIYYGEEIGMEGGADPDDRRGMRWDLANDANPMLAYYKRLIAARNASPTLQRGDPAILMTDDAAGTLAYARVLGDEVAVVLVNRANESRTLSVPLSAVLQHSGGVMVDVLSGQKVTIAPGQTQLTLTVPAMSALILLPAQHSPAPG